MLEILYQRSYLKCELQIAIEYCFQLFGGKCSCIMCAFNFFIVNFCICYQDCIEKLHRNGQGINQGSTYREFQMELYLPSFSLPSIFFFFFFKFLKINYLFIFGWVGSSFLCEGFLQLRQEGATLHRDARASHHRGLSCCGAQAPDAQARQLWLTGPVAPRHVGSSQTRARTRVPCIGRQTLNHCATKEAPKHLLQNLHDQY